ncbi:MAG TPA: hypothetical protein VKP68_06100 [Ramlibacter sp.]|nr:hypothetical protein [Ramlibacter sp.]
MGHAPTTLLTWVLRHLPSGWHAALDAWSYRVAQKRAQRRREAGKRADTGKLRPALKS